MRAKFSDQGSALKTLESKADRHLQSARIKYEAQTGIKLRLEVIGCLNQNDLEAMLAKRNAANLQVAVEGSRDRLEIASAPDMPPSLVVHVTFIILGSFALVSLTIWLVTASG